MDLQLVYGDESALNKNSVLQIPAILNSPFLIYDALANLSSSLIGVFVHSEFIDGYGWVIVDRYPVYSGVYSIAINKGFNQPYKLAFIPAVTRTDKLAFKLRLWKPAENLPRSPIVEQPNNEPVTVDLTPIANQLTTLSTVTTQIKSEVDSLYTYFQSQQLAQTGPTKTNLALQLRATDTYLSSTSIMQSVDLSGNGFSSIPIYTPPTLIANAIKSKPAIRFNNSPLTTNSTYNDFNFAAYTVQVLVRIINGGSIIGKNSAADNSGARRKLQLSNGSLNSGVDGQTFNFTPMPTNEWHVLSVNVKSGTNIDVWIDKTKLSTGQPNLDTSSFNGVSLYIGCGFGNGAESFSGDLAELLIYKQPLSDDSVLANINVMGTFWGLSFT